jgi:prevent-host-death family protein
MRSYSIEVAAKNLGKLITEVERGEQVELRRGGTPVARVVPASPRHAPHRQPGALAGQIHISDDFDDLPDDIARALGMID